MNKQPIQQKDSMEQVIKFYSGMVYRLALARTGTIYDADEVYQEVFLRYIRKNPEFKSEEHRKAWLIRVTVNCSKSLLSSAWRKKTQALDDSIMAPGIIFEEIYDSFSINRPFDSTAVCELAGFDVSAKKATFLITMNEWGNKNIEGDKITFSVREFLSHKTIYDNQYIPVSLTGIQPAEDTRPVAVYGLGGPDVNRTDRDNITALSPGSPIEGFPIDGIDFTGIGYIDGKLHIQTRTENVLENDNHGYFYLKDRNGKEIKYDYSFNFSDNDEASARYCEYVFDIPIQTISSYSLYGYFVISGMKTEGNWSVTFPLETEPEHNIK